MTLPRPIRVVGVGSPHGDDALAWEAIRLLREEPGDFETHLVEGGYRLLDLLDGRGTLLLVDALEPRGQPGTIRRFTWPGSDLDALRAGTTHDLGPTEALQLATALSVLPEHIIIFGMEVGGCASGAGLSPEVSAALPELRRRIILELEISAEEHVRLEA